MEHNLPRFRELVFPRRSRLRCMPKSIVGLVTLCVAGVLADAQAASRQRSSKLDPSSAPVHFAPVPTNHPLASLWNDPDFNRRLLGSYGFASDIEPRLTPEEQAAYRDKVVPLLREDPKRAIPALEALVKPNASAVFDFTLGNIHFQQEDLTNAVRLFESALAKFPDFLRAHKNLGFAMMREGKYQEAIPPLTRALALGGGDGKIFGLLGFAYTSLGRHSSAEGAYRQALVFEPENTDFKLGLVKCAIAGANYDHALALLEEMLQQYPEREQLWVLHANLCIQKDRPSAAIVSLEVLRRLGKASAPHLFLLGDLYMTQNATDLALRAYLAGLESAETANPAKALRAAQILVSRAAWTEARLLIQKIRQALPSLESEDTLRLLKLEAKAATATGSPDQAIQLLEQVLQKDPLDAEALLLAGDHYAKHNDPIKAEFRYQTAARIEGAEADALVKHAQLLVQSRKYAQALDLLRKAQKVKPRDNIQRYLEKVEQLARTSNS